MTRLAAVDEVAYVRFASVYRQFRDVNQFMDELKSILSKKKIKNMKKQKVRVSK
jgi:transcriptional repressor NrdR